MSALSRRLAIAGLIMVPLLAGCGCGDADAHRIRTVVQSFEAALAAGQGQTACRLLTPETAAEVPQSEESSCASAIVKEDLPPPGQIVAVKRFGNSAQLVSAGDVMFLARFPPGWKITAVGCTARSGQPYDCLVASG
jgi:hypothetical protein